MGGNAFTGGDSNLLFPRLPPRLYKQLKDDIITRLLKHFEYAQVPIEGPEKTSYGDIDVLVCNPISPATCDPERLSLALSAQLWKQVKGSDTINLAFDWPQGEANFPCRSPPLGSPFASAMPSINTPSQSAFSTKRCLYQVDVHICTSPKSLDWMLFSHAHGDMWNVLGSIIRPFGLVRNQQGLLIIMPEIAEFADMPGGGGIPKHLQRVLLTDDPSSTLGFLGLDETQYWKPFESVDQMFDFTAGCRFYITWDEKGREGEQGEDAGGVQGRQSDSKDTTRQSGRRRVNQRLIFRRWLTDYIPAHPRRPYRPIILPATPTAESPNTDAADTTQVAKAFFGAGFANRYSTARDRSLLIFGAQRLWADVRRLLTTEKGAEGSELGYAMKGLKRCVQPEGFDAWVQAVLARGECESLEPTACPSDSLFSAGSMASGERREVAEEGDEDERETRTTMTTEENVVQKVRDLLGFYVPGIPTVRRHFRACEFDRVKKWVFGREDGSIDAGNGNGNGNGNDHGNDIGNGNGNGNGNCNDNDSMWQLVSRLQQEKDMAESRQRRGRHKGEKEKEEENSKI